MSATWHSYRVTVDGSLWSVVDGGFIVDDGRTATDVADIAQLASILAAQGFKAPATVQDVRRELVRRQCALIGVDPPSEFELQRRILAGTREATELQNIKIKHLTSPSLLPDWTASQAQWAAYLEHVESQLSALEAVADELSASLPVDFASDERWQTAQ